MVTGTIHLGKQSLLDTVRLPQDDNSIIRSLYPKSKSNFRDFYTFLAATGGIVGREHSQENDYRAVIRKGFWEHKDPVDTIT